MSLKALDKDFKDFETRIFEVLTTNFKYIATKEDVAKTKTRIILWTIGTIIAVAILTITIVKLIH